MDPANLTPIAADEFVFLGPFCDEEHAREILEPMLAGYNVRIETPDDEDLGAQLYEAEVLETSEGMWVATQAGLSGRCDEEYTEYGFQVVNVPDPEDEWGPPKTYQVYALVKAEGKLHRGELLREHPGSGEKGAVAEVWFRGNTTKHKETGWIVELHDRLGDRDLNDTLHAMLLAGDARFEGKPGLWRLIFSGSDQGVFEDQEKAQLEQHYAELNV